MKNIINFSFVLIIATLLSFSGCGGDGGDTTPDPTTPTVTLSINDGDTDVAVDSTLVIEFSESIDVDTVTNSSFYLSNGSSNVVGTITYNSDFIIFTFTPDSNLEYSTEYTAYLTSSIKSRHGATLVANQISFTTIDANPTLTLTPADTTTDVDPSTVISAEFSQNTSIDFTTVTTDSFYVTSNSANVTGVITYDSSNNSATFTPSTKLSLLTTYDVYLSDTIISTANKSLSNTTASFTTRDGIWGNSTNITVNDNRSYTPQITYDKENNPIAIWVQGDGSNDSIYFNKYDATTSSWGNASLVESAAGSASYPQIAVDSDNNIFAIWAQTDTYLNIYSSIYSSTTQTWSNATLLETFEFGTAANPQIVIDSQNNAIAVWQERDTNGDYRIYSNRYESATQSWGNATLIESVGGQDPKIAIDINDNVHVVWRVGFINNVYANRYDSTTQSWGNETLIDSGTLLPQYPEIAVDSNNNAIAIWYENDGSYQSIYANIYDSTTQSWGNASLVENETGDAYTPKIAVNSSNTAFAVWEQTDGTNYGIYCAELDATTHTWGNATLISTPSIESWRADIAFDTNDDAFAIFTQNDDIYINRYDSTSQTWGNATLIESGSNAADEAKIAVGTNNNVGAIWLQPNTTNDVIFSNIFE